MFRNCKNIYIDFLPVFIVPSTAIGIFSGLISSTHCNTNEVFLTIMGYTSMGFISGLFYPITTPLLAGYIFQKKSSNSIL